VLGALASAIPCLGGSLSSRLLFLPSLGSCALVAAALAALYDRALAAQPHSWLRRRTGAVFGAIMLIHGVVALGICAAHNLVYHWICRGADQVVNNTHIDRNTRVVALVASDPLAAHTLVNVWPLAGTRPKSLHLLSMAPCNHVLERLDPKRLRLRARCPMLGTELERFYRPERFPLPLGSSFDLSGLKVTVAELQGGHPTAIEVALAAPLTEYRFVSWREGRLQPVALPEPGRSIELAWSRGPLGL
jgi:hypothetical protein